MRRTLVLPLVLLTACSAAGDAPPAVSAPLVDLHLVEDHPEIPAAVFPHDEHTREDAEGRRATCVDCHHELADAPGDVPRACRDCHVFSYLTDPVDESQPHDHDLPPDL